MLVELFRNNLAKSTGRMTLFEHALGAALIAAFVLKNFAPPGYPEEKKDLLLFSAFTHDLGKLDPQFQLMLQAAADGRPLPGKRVKHEASSLEYADLLAQAKEEIIALLAAATGRRIRGEIDPDLVMAFAVTHHGLFYLSREQTVNYGEKWLIRREWTVTNPGERERITLVDLLFLFHPLGGLVMVADLVHSYCHGKGIDFRQLLSRASSYARLVEFLLAQADDLEGEVEKAENREEQGLRDLLMLLAGGLV